MFGSGQVNYLNILDENISILGSDTFKVCRVIYEVITLLMRYRTRTMSPELELFSCHAMHRR